jgi:hypothetical protein
LDRRHASRRHRNRFRNSGPDRHLVDPNNIISGTASSRGWTCTIEDNPTGFCLIVCSRAAIAGFAIAEILYAFGLCAGPIKTLQHALPFLPANPRHTSDLIQSHWV